MTSRRLWSATLIWVVGLTAAGASRGSVLLLFVAALASAWLVRAGGAVVLCGASVAAVAWCSSIGPWSGPTRIWVAVVAGVLTASVGVGLRRGHARTTGAIVAAMVLASLAVARGVPVHGTQPTGPGLRAVDAYLRDQADRAGIPGVAVAIVEGGEIIFDMGYGSAGGGQPMTTDTPVVIGSTSKSITALVVLQLVEDGRVRLDATVGRYLPWFRPADPRAAAVTVRQLLVDTSGIPTFAGWSALAGDGRANPDTIRTLVNNLRLTSDPGDRFQYSNANYIILGQIIESVTGEPYGDVVEETIFGPLGMANSRAATAPSTPNRYWFGLPVPSHLPYLQIGLPAGALSSSAADLARYAKAQLGHPAGDAPSMLSAANLELAHTPAVVADGFGIPAGRRYGMGWYIGAIADEPAVFHSGDVFDSSSTLILLPERDLGVVIVATASSAVTPIAQTLGEGVTATLLDRPAPDFARSLALATTATLAVAGVVFAFAATRARRLLVGEARRHPVSVVRTIVLDLLTPLAVLAGLPMLFSMQLDRAETLSPLQFWRLIGRGLPDLAVVLLASLLLRSCAASLALMRLAAQRDRHVTAGLGRGPERLRAR